MAADVAGYTRLMERDSDGTVAAWQSARSEVIDPLIVEHAGRIVKHTGDGFLAEFPTVQNAVECAIAMQAALTARPLDFRMGVNLGDIIDDGEDIHGEGVNIAARIEALADPGGICISGSVHNQVLNRLDYQVEDMGEVDVKNVARPVRVFKILTADAPAIEKADASVGRQPLKLVIASVVLAVAVIAGGALWWQMRPDFEPVEPESMVLELPDNPSIAVLPFNYFGEGKAENDYIADGLSEQITSVLASVPGLFVIARNSSFTYKGKAVDVREVAKRFGVRYVLEGSVQKSGDQLRVTAQLIDAVAGTHIWARTFDRKFTDLFEIQDEITLSVARNIRGTTLVGDRFKPTSTDSLAAWVESVQAREEMRKYTAESLKNARRHFEKAIEYDPNFVMPYSLTAMTHALDVRYGYSPDPKKSFALAAQNIEKALALDPSSSPALVTLGFLRFVQKRYPEARKLAFKAYEGAPNLHFVVYALAWILKHGGESAESLPYFARIKRIQPVVPRDVLYDEFTAHLDAGKFEAARKLVPAYLAKASERTLPRTLVFSAVSFLKTSDRAEADAMVAKALALRPELSIKDFRYFELPYADKSIPGRWFAAMRELGVPDLPPSERADTAKAKVETPDKPSIAVLPFANFSDDKEQEYFADGMTDDLITDLSKISGLSVIARNSSFTYKGHNTKIQEIARDLNVRFVLEGSVRRAGDTVRINAQLIDGATGVHVWGETFDRPFTDIFALQDEVTERIVANLSIKLTPDEKHRITRHETESLEAHDLVLRARRQESFFNQAASKKAVAYLKQAIAIDPNYAEAYARLSILNGINARLGWVGNIAEAHEEALNLAQRALELEADLPIAHFSLGRILARPFYRKYDRAIEAFQQTIQLDPNHADSYANLALVSIFTGNAVEAESFARTAMEINPLFPFWYLHARAMSYYYQGKYDLAVEDLREAADRNPTAFFVRYWLAAALAQIGEIEDAKWEVEEWQTAGQSMTLEELLKINPITYPPYREKLVEGLRIAGYR